MKIIFLSKNDITLRKLPSHVQLAIKLELEVSTFGIMIDELNDIQVTKHLDIYVIGVGHNPHLKILLS
ncbi:6989_t:CDS:2 [Entrophospora sp. SA101]|nr:6989_t:CDS:2 [Entrophospora sp. SA101]